MRILLIGGCGFIGRHAAAEFVRLGHEVTVLHRGRTDAVPGAAQMVGDRRELPALCEALVELGPEVVVDMILSSAEQARALMSTFAGVARRVVVASSCDAYRAVGVLHGTEPGPLEPLPLTEESPLRLLGGAYPREQIVALKAIFPWLDDAYDKVPAEQEVMRHPELPGTVLRFPMVYGPGDHLHRLFPLVRRIDDGRAELVLEERVASWRGARGYVEDVAAAVVLAALSEQAAGRVYNVAAPEALSEREWAEHVGAAMGWRGRVVSVPWDLAPAHLRQEGNLAQHWVVDTTRLRTELGYAERVPLDEALRRTIAWERAHPPPFEQARNEYAAEDRALAALR
jgi:nucleoside-diphosphate-sugar epimerase